MWNRPLLFFWFSMNLQSEKHHIRFEFPLPLFILTMFLDMADDLLDFANLITAGHIYREKDKWSSPYMSKQWIRLLQSMLSELIWKGESDDIMDIDVEEDHQRIKMKLLLR